LRKAPRLSERDVQNSIIDFLRRTGWMVREISQRHAVHGDLVGVPDIVAWKHGVTLLIECKRPGGKMRASQVSFSDEISSHLAPTLRYTVASDIDEFMLWLTSAANVL